MSAAISGVLNGAARVSQVGNAVSAAGNLAALGGAALSGYLSPAMLSGLGPWAWSLRPASFRSVPFAVRASRLHGGRRTAVHQYPYRDVVWVEDLGQGLQSYTFQAFLVGDDVYRQRDDLKAAIDVPGPATLVHPSLGSLQAVNVEFSAGESAERGRVVELELTFIQSPPSPVYPAAANSTQSQTLLQAAKADLAAAGDFLARVSQAIKIGADVVQDGVLKAVEWARLASSAVADARLIADCANGLPSINGGRYASGAQIAPQPLGTTVTSALAALTLARETTAADVAAIPSATAATLPTTVQRVAADVLAAAIDPADQVRLLSNMAGYTATTTSTTAAIGAALVTMQTSTAALCRRASLTALARATAAYQPSSYNDAVAQLDAVTALLDAEVIGAADVGDNDTYLALRALRTAVAQDLITRGSALPKLITVRRAVPLPSLALSYSLYGTAARSDELIARADPVNPCFMPLVFEALAS